jgi:propanol-preferring alcohol dehydrogenase
VLVYHRPGCDHCPQCLAGCSNVCTGSGRSRVDGSDADYHLCFADRLFLLPAAMDWETAVVISCQAGTAYAPLVRVGASGRSVLVVSGLGPVGLCAVMLGREMGATIVGVDPMAERRALGTRFGATAVVDPRDGDLVAQLRDLTRDGVDAVIETSGNPAAQAAAVDLLRVEGTIAFVGLGSRQPSIAPATMFGRQLSAYGSNLYPQRMLPEIFDFVQRRRVPLADIITDRFPLEEAPAAFRLADTATTGKIVFAWD